VAPLPSIPRSATADEKVEDDEVELYEMTIAAAVVAVTARDHAPRPGNAPWLAETSLPHEYIFQHENKYAS